MLQLDRSVQAAHPGADDDDREVIQTVRRRILLPLDPSHPRIQRQLLDPQRDVFLHQLLDPRRQRQAPRQAFERSRVDRPGTAIPVHPEELDCLGPQAPHIFPVGDGGRHGWRDVGHAGRGDAGVAGQLVKEPA